MPCLRRIEAHCLEEVFAHPGIPELAELGGVQLHVDGALETARVVDDRQGEQPMQNQQRAGIADRPPLGEAHDLGDHDVAHQDAERTEHPPPGRIIYFYVLDADNRLDQVIQVRDFVNILIIDGDLRKPALSTRFGARGLPGLTSIVVGSSHLEEALYEVEPGRLSWLGLGRKTGWIEMYLRLEPRDALRENKLKVTVLMRSYVRVKNQESWKARCNMIYNDLRGYLMGQDLEKKGSAGDE